MLYEDNTAKLLGLEDVIVKKVWDEGQEKHIEIELPRRMHVCPCCGTETDQIHDYRMQCIKDIASFGKNVYFHLKGFFFYALLFFSQFTKNVGCSSAFRLRYPNIYYRTRFYRPINLFPDRKLDKQVHFQLFLPMHFPTRFPAKRTAACA